MTNCLSHDLNLRKLSLDTSLFRRVYLVLISLEMIAFLDIISLILKSIVLIWGLFILVHNFFINKLAFKVRYKYILWSFLVLMIITSIVHTSIWFIPNIVIVYYTAICFFVFYGIYVQQSCEDTEKEMVFILKFFVYFGFIFGTLSILSLFMKQKIDFAGYYLGIYRNRLIGVYTNSNILAFSMIESIVACDILSDTYIKRKYKLKNMQNWKLFLFCIISCVCLFLSDSNASFVFLLVYFTIRFFCSTFFKSRARYVTKFIKSILMTLGFGIIMMSASFGVRDICQNYMSEVISGVHRHEGALKRKFETRSINIIASKGKEISREEYENSSAEDKYIADFHIGREHYEVSSGRITLFKQGLEIFKHNPWLGIGRANLGLYSKKYLKNGLIHPDLHNGYLTILVSCGIIGFLIFLVFSILVALDVCKYLFICTESDMFNTFSKLFSILVAYCSYCLFEKAILFDMTFMVGFFWSMLGYTMSYVYNKNYFDYKKLSIE